MMDYGGGSSTNRHVADNQQPTKSIRKDKRRNSSAGSSEGGGSESGKVVPSSFMERISNRFGRGSNTSTANAGQHSNSSASAGGGGGVLGSPTLSYGGVDNNNRNSRSPSEFSVEGGALGGRDGGDSDGVEVVARVAPTPHQRMWALIVDHNTSNGLIIKTIGVGGVLPANSSTAPKPPTYNGVSSLSLIHISEPTRLLSISYAVFCLKKKKKLNKGRNNSTISYNYRVTNYMLHR
eukprot:TRINITY_DN26126_c0_g1_i1.p1 TRINITY_DN26126_c0_g1~~TRINITY_DN26126_c0_g1_i1.p1  ORF type:complete len:236 (-),score=48.81 TRINITY_DN26126_c0_g1_i1:20-727(-)